MSVDLTRLNQAMIDAAPLYAGLLAGRGGIELIWDPNASTASIQERRMRLPVIPLDDPALAALTFGFILHEDGHLQESAFDCQFESDLHRDVSNILEDTRVEVAQCQRYRGARDMFIELMDVLIDRGAFGSVDDSLPLHVQIRRFLLYWKNAELLYPRLASAAKQQEVITEQLVGSAFMAALKALISRAVTAQNSHEVVAIARDIIALIKDAAAEPDANTDTDQPQGDASADQPQGDASAEKPQGDVGQLQLAPIHGSASPSEFRSLLAASYEAGGIAEVSANLLGTEAAKAPNTNKVAIATTEPVADVGDGAKWLEETSAATRALALHIEDKLRAQTRRKYCPSSAGSRLRRDAVGRLLNGNVRVMERRGQSVEIDTAVEILLDASTSMMGIKMRLACQAVLASSLAIDKVANASLGVSVFPYEENGRVGIVKDFDESTRHLAGRIDALNVCGTTPLDGALLSSFGRLLQCSEARKICLVVTDGKPDNEESVTSLLELAPRLGIEVMALGIKNDATLFSERTQVSDLNELSSRLLEMLVHALTSKSSLMAA